MKKRTEITIETSRRLIVRRLSRNATVWCDKCLASVEMITPDEAAVVLNVSSRVIYRWIEDGQVHFIDNFTGLLVCTRSLPLNNGEPATELPQIPD